MEMETDSDHIVFRKQKLDLLKHQMNEELNNKRKIMEEFEKMNKANKFSNQGD